MMPLGYTEREHAKSRKKKSHNVYKRTVAVTCRGNVDNLIIYSMYQTIFLFLWINAIDRNTDKFHTSWSSLSMDQFNCMKYVKKWKKLEKVFF